MRHAIDTGLHKTRGEDQWMSKLTERQVCEIYERSVTGRETLSDIGNDYDVTPQTVYDIKVKRRWTWLLDKEPIIPTVLGD